MADGQDDYHQLINQKRFMGEVEQGVRFANREVIHQRIPSISKDDILGLAVSVGRLRASYLDAAFKLCNNDHGGTPEQSDIKELRSHREMYEESRIAFEALREAIEKGYLDIKEIRGAEAPQE